MFCEPKSGENLVLSGLSGCRPRALNDQRSTMMPRSIVSVMVRAALS